jgi:CYTH domain-containing protein
MVEIERKFLVWQAPSRGDAASIVQGYLTTGDPEIRIRSRSGEFFLTLKRGVGIARGEIEQPVNPALGEVLLSLASPRIIAKHRLAIGRWEIDYYGGYLEGLVVAEIELSAVGDQLPPIPSGVELGPELTGDNRFANQALACLTEEEARHLLESIRAFQLGLRGHI